LLYDQTQNADSRENALIPKDAALAEVAGVILSDRIKAYAKNGEAVTPGILSQTGKNELLCVGWRLSREAVLKLWPKQPPPSRKHNRDVPLDKVKQAMLRICETEFDKTGNCLMRDDAVSRCQEKTHCDRAKARQAFAALPDRLRNRQGRKVARENRP
jgi:hypothetical protein